MLEVKTWEDFQKLREQFSTWRRRHPMFSHDVKAIEKSIEVHMKAHMDHIIKYKQSRKKQNLVNAQHELDQINKILNTVSKVELMAILSQR